MKIAKSKLKQIIKEELVVEAGGQWVGGGESFRAVMALSNAIATETGQTPHDIGVELFAFLEKTFYQGAK